MPQITIPMTTEQYAADERTICPCCHKEGDIKCAQIDIVDPKAFQQAHCPECESSWVDTYKRTGFEVSEMGHGIKAPRMTPAEYSSLDKGDSHGCIFCGCPDVKGEQPFVAGRFLFQDCICLDCDSEWVDTYERSGYEQLERGNPLPEFVAFMQVKAPLRTTRAMVVAALSDMIQIGQADAAESLEKMDGGADEVLQIAALLEAKAPSVQRTGTEGSQALYVIVQSMEAPQGASSEAIRDAIRKLVDIGQNDAVKTLELPDWESQAATKLAARLEIAALAVSLKEVA